ncbi:MAG: ammonia-forming cytochrome c nitrite reductase subunit c552 [Chlorobi bacterium]|nr:ammonia-forming cytochrome c nitrite reductase subunit c552 [Chlorobiota bacterium]
MSHTTKSCLYFALVSLLALFSPVQSSAQSKLNCSQCHKTENDQWVLSRHANTQNDVAGELAEEWAGLPPDSVIVGQNAEDCVACHGATSIAANGGMTEIQAMGYFFSTTNGLYTDSTRALHTDEWPHNACVTCHDVPGDHPATMPRLAIFNSPTARYDSLANTSTLCGQCHGTLRFPDTDHRRFDAWQLSKHGHGGQDDVAGELAEEWAGSTPEAVIGEEDCVACHASTSVLLNGGISEAKALGLLFTTENGVFTANTAPNNTDMWPEVACISCHNQHNPDEVSYFNSGTKKYEALSSSQDLCGKCHGNLRFPDTDHLSYNIAQGTGGLGVKDVQTMPGIKCVDCHMHISDVEDTNASMYAGHLWSTFIKEEDGTESSSCTSCHSSMDAKAAHLVIQRWQSEYSNLDSIANVKVAEAESILKGSNDSTKIHMLQEAQFNLAFAEGDESAGVHNHNYTVSLLNDAIQKATSIVTGVDKDLNPVAKEFALYQNYPNPFNPTTMIKYQIPKYSLVTLKVYNILGEEVAELVNAYNDAGSYTVRFNTNNLPGGIYMYKIQAGKYSAVKSMLLLK